VVVARAGRFFLEANNYSVGPKTKGVEMPDSCDCHSVATGGPVWVRKLS
jgi:hypothetical protein